MRRCMNWPREPRIRNVLAVNHVRSCTTAQNPHKEEMFRARAERETLPEFDNRGRLQDSEMPTIVDMMNGQKVGGNKL